MGQRRVRVQAALRRAQQQVGDRDQARPSAHATDRSPACDSSSNSPATRVMYNAGNSTAISWRTSTPAALSRCSPSRSAFCAVPSCATPASVAAHSRATRSAASGGGAGSGVSGSGPRPGGHRPARSRAAGRAAACAGPGPPPPVARPPAASGWSRGAPLTDITVLRRLAEALAIRPQEFGLPPIHRADRATRPNRAQRNSPPGPVPLVLIVTSRARMVRTQCDAGQLSMYGTLLEVAAYTAAVDGSRGAATELIDEAQATATRLR